MIIQQLTFLIHAKVSLIKISSYLTNEMNARWTMLHKKNYICPQIFILTFMKFSLVKNTQFSKLQIYPLNWG